MEMLLIATCPNPECKKEIQFKHPAMKHFETHVLHCSCSVGFVVEVNVNVNVECVADTMPKQAVAAEDGYFYGI